MKRHQNHFLFKFFACLLIYTLLNSNLLPFASANNDCLAPKTVVKNTPSTENISNALFNNLVNDAYNNTYKQKVTKQTNTLNAISPSIIELLKNNFLNTFTEVFTKINVFYLNRLTFLQNVITSLKKYSTFLFNVIAKKLAVLGLASLLIITSCIQPYDPILDPVDPIYEDTFFTIGSDDNSSNEFASNNFDANFYANTESVSDFPKELNASWFSEMYIYFELSTPQNLTLSLDAAWQNGKSSLTIAVEIWKDGVWKNTGNVVLTKQDNGYVNIPYYMLQTGQNEMRLKMIKDNDYSDIVYWDQISLKPATQLVPQEVITMAETITETSLNYFLSDDVVHSSGLIPTAYDLYAGIQPQLYSNQAEWGILLQTYIIAAETGKISSSEANTKITQTLNTIANLQNDPNQYHDGLFYPFYRLNTATPYHDEIMDQSIGNNAMLWLSLNTIQGWLMQNGFGTSAEIARDIMSKINLRVGFRDFGSFAKIYYTRNAVTGELSTNDYDVYADIDGMIAFAAFASGSITKDEYRKLCNTQKRYPATWNGFTVAESSFLNAANGWIQRPLAGFPLFENTAASTFATNSFLPAMEAYIAYGDSLNIAYPGFSIAPSQDIHKRFYPPNFRNYVDNAVPDNVMPHALIVPLAGMKYLDEATLKAYYDALVRMRNDTKAYWTNNFGFKVLASPYRDVGTNAAPSKYETYSTGYSAIAGWYGLQILKGEPTFYDFARTVPGYSDKVTDAIDILYGGGLKNIGEDDAILTPKQSKEIISLMNKSLGKKTEKTINKENIKYILIETETDSDLDKAMKDAGITNGAYNLTTNGETFILINKDISHYDLAKQHEEYEIMSKNYLINNQKVNGNDIQQTAHKLAWASQILNNKWEKAESIDFVQNQLKTKSIDDLVDIIKEKREDHILSVSKHLNDLYPGINIKEKIENFEKSFKDYSFVLIYQKIIEQMQNTVTSFDINLIKETINNIIKQTKDVMDKDTYKRLIDISLNKTIPTLDKAISSFTEKIYENLKNKTAITLSA